MTNEPRRNGFLARSVAKVVRCLKQLNVSVGSRDFDSLHHQQRNQLRGTLRALAGHEIKLSFELLKCRFEELSIISEPGFAIRRSRRYGREAGGEMFGDPVAEG